MRKEISYNYPPPPQKKYYKSVSYKKSLHIKFSLLIIAIVLITSATLNIVFKHYYMKNELKDIEQHIMEISKLETVHFAHHILKNELQIMHHHIVDYTSALKNLSDIRVYDKQGYLIVDKKGIKRELPSDKKIKSAIQSKSMLHLWDGFIFRHFEPVVINDKEIIGFLYMEYNANYLKEYLAKQRNFFITLTGIITFVSITIGIAFSRRLTEPLKAVADASKKVAEGDLSVSVPVKSKDELGILAENFNYMVESLKSSRAEVENYTENLEHVTERLNNALTELQHEKDFIDKLLSTIGATIAVLDREGKIVRVNRTWENVRGYREEEVKGKFVWDFMPGNAAITARIMFEEMLVNKTPSTFKIAVLTKDGKERIMLTNNAVITDENGEVKYVIATGIDVTEKEHLEKTLAETQRLRSIATLVTGLSHNFNNILVGVLGYAGMLRMELTSIEHQRKTDILKYIDTIENSANRASELIKHLMLFSKKAEYQVTEVNINNVINDILQIISAAFPESISIQTDLQKDLWMIKADKNQIQQAILNICINARDAMPQGGMLRIETSNKDFLTFTPKNHQIFGGPRQSEHATQGAGRYVVVRIQDTGHGMDEETKLRIFEPFFTTRSLVHHTGLGLSIAYNIIKNHNGLIKVDSEINKGSIFTIFLPAV